MRPLLASAAFLLVTLPGLSTVAHAQTQPTTVKDAAPLRAPIGSRVAIVAFEDLECPACSRAFPVVHQAVEHYKIPLVRHDFPLQMHIWSRDAAITARYIQDKISPQAAEEFRAAVFQNQASISSKDDLQTFTQSYFQKHGRTMPFVMDPTGQFAREVQADYDLGVRVGLNHTPSIFVVTSKGYQEILDVNQLYATIDAAEASVGTPAAPRTTSSKLRRPTSPTP